MLNLKVTSIEAGTLPFNPLGPVPNAKLLLENKFGTNPTNIAVKTDEYLQSLKSNESIISEEFRAFFWQGNEQSRSKMTQWVKLHIASFDKIDYKNKAILTTQFYLFGIKGLVFAENLLESPLDPLAMDLAKPKAKELFDDLVEVFRFIRKLPSGKRYIEEKFPTTQGLKRAIKEWQEMESRFKIGFYQGNLKVTADGTLRETDLLVLYPVMVATLRLQMESIFQVLQEQKDSRK